MTPVRQLQDAARRWAAAKAEVEAAELELLKLSMALDSGEEFATDLESAATRIARLRLAILRTRKARAWSQKKLGIAIGYAADSAQSRVSQIENGSATVTSDLIVRICDALGVTPTELEQAGNDGVESPSPRTPMSQTKRKIVEALKRTNGEPVTIATLSDRIGCTTSDCFAEADELVDEGLVAKVPGGFVIAKEAA